MAVLSLRGKSLSSEIQFFRNYDLTGGDFEGPTLTDSTLLAPDGKNWFADGFYFQPDTIGDVVALSYQDYILNNKVIDDALAQILPSCASGIFHPTRVVKIYQLGTVSTNITIGV